MMKVETAVLRDGHTLPRILGTGWKADGDIDHLRVMDGMLAQVEAGLVVFDCDASDSRLLILLGEFVARFRQEFGTAAAEAIKVHLSLAPDPQGTSGARWAAVGRAVDDALASTRFERLDLVQLSWPATMPGHVDAAHRLTDLQAMGKIDLLGTADIDPSRLNDILSAGIDIAAVRARASILDRDPGGDVLTFCRDHGMSVLCHGALADGLLTRHWLGRSEPIEGFELGVPPATAALIERFGGWPLFQDLLRTLRRIGYKHGVSMPDVAIRYLLDQPGVVGVVADTASPEALEDALQVFAFSLDQADLTLIDQVLVNAWSS